MTDVLKKRLFAFIRRAVLRYRESRKKRMIRRYYRNGQNPFGPGYGPAKLAYLRNVFDSPDVMHCFRKQQSLPDRYGFRFDERVIELPWVLAHDDSIRGRVLDAGSALNDPELLQYFTGTGRNLHILTLSPESHCGWHQGISYLFEDLRNLPYRDEWFDTCICISTLEHVGMDTRIYTKSKHPVPVDTAAYLQALAELKRVLKKGGILYLTVPFGQYENHGWLQQFDVTMIDKVISVFHVKKSTVAYFRYVDGTGWQIAGADECQGARYVDRVSPGKKDGLSADRAVAAGAVACMECIK